MKYLLFLWLIYPVAEAFIQTELRSEHGWKPNYLQLFVIRAFFAIIHGAILDTQGGYWGVFDWEWATLITFQFTSFWLIFDLLYNYLNGTHLLYRGEESGWLDRMPLPLWYIGKIVSLILLPLSIIAYLKYYA